MRAGKEGSGSASPPSPEEEDVGSWLSEAAMLSSGAMAKFPFFVRPVLMAPLVLAPPDWGGMGSSSARAFSSARALSSVYWSGSWSMLLRSAIEKVMRILDLSINLLTVVVD